METLVLEGGYAECLLTLAYKAGAFSKYDMIDEYEKEPEANLFNRKFHHDTVRHVLNSYVASKNVTLISLQRFKQPDRLSDYGITLSKSVPFGYKFDYAEIYQKQNNYLAMASHLYDELGTTGLEFFCSYSTFLLNIITKRFFDYIKAQQEYGTDWQQRESYMQEYFNYYQPISVKSGRWRKIIFEFALVYLMRFLDKYIPTKPYRINLNEIVRQGSPTWLDPYLENYQELLLLNNPIAHLLSTIFHVMLTFGFTAKERLLNRLIVSSSSLRDAHREIARKNLNRALVPNEEARLNVKQGVEVRYALYSLSGCERVMFPINRFDHAFELRKSPTIDGYRRTIQRLIDTDITKRDQKAEELHAKSVEAIRTKYTLERIDKMLYLSALPASIIPIVGNIHTILSTGIRFWIERTKKHHQWIDLVDRL